MPYRASSHAGPACYRHAAAVASATCSRCLQPVCEVCVMFDATSTTCPRCHRRALRTATLKRCAIGLVGVGLIGCIITAAGYVVTREKPYDWGVQAPKIRALLADLKREPCDQMKIVELGDTLNLVGDYRDALRQAQAFFTHCGPLPRLLWVTYGAHQRLSEHEQAIADATQLIEASPSDKDFWWWRGMVYEQTGQLEKAAADYEHSIALQPALGNIPFNLADVYERMRQPCDAARVVEQFLRYHPEVESRQEISERAARLRRMGRCPIQASRRPVDKIP